MDPAELEHFRSELASLAFNFEQEQVGWKQAFKAQEAELRALSARQEAIQWRQDELEASLIELRGATRAEFSDLGAMIERLRSEVDALAGHHEREVESGLRLRDRVDGLSSVMDEVFDDVASRITHQERELHAFGLELGEQRDLLSERLAQAHDRITEGLAEAYAAADTHADRMIELRDVVADARAESDAQRQEVAKQVLELEVRVEAEQETIRKQVVDLEARLQARRAADQAALTYLERSIVERMAHLETASEQNGRTFAQFQQGVQLEIRGLGEVLSQLASQGQMLAEALESVQQGSIHAELQLNTALREQVEATRSVQEAMQQRIEQAIGSLHAALSKTHQQIKELESKAVKALSLQRGENQEYERSLSALREDYAQLNNRVGTIVQLLTKASRPSPVNDRA